MRKPFVLLFCAFAISSFAATPTLTVDASRSAGNVSPKLYGLMTEEINHSYDGGLYAELIRNRAFLDNPDTPVNWWVVDNGNNGNQNPSGTITLDSTNAFNDKLTTSLRFTVTKASKDHPVGVENSGYWGIPVQPNTRYRATLLARAGSDFTGPV